MNKGILFDIERGSYVDGPGIRTTVFFKGCNLRCAWCHNPESQSTGVEMMFYKDKCTGCGKCREKCPNGPESCGYCGICVLFCPHDAREISGKEYTVAAVMQQILKDLSFYENSNGGVTFSGGECMLQIDFLEELLETCKAHGIHTAVDTAGHVPYEYFQRILPYTDLFLYDIKIFDNAKHRQYIGAGNELILENFRKLLDAGANIWIRVPVIAGVNDDTAEMENIRDFFRQNGMPEKIELLPYHVLGEHKYAALGRENRTFAAPSPERMAALRRIFNA